MFILLVLPLYYLLFHNSRDRVLFYFGVFLLFFLSAFRATSVGVDTLTYLSDYNYSKTEDLKYLWNNYFTEEPIYFSLASLFSRWGYSYRFFMIIQSFLFLVPITFGLRILNEKPIASLTYLILLGYFFCSLNLTRQLIALSFCFLGYCLIEKKRFLLSLWTFIVAIGFHTASIVAIIAFVLCFIPLDRIYKIITIIVLVLSYSIPMVIDLSSYMVSSVEQFALFNSFLYYIEQEFSTLDRLPIYNTLRTGLFIYAIYNYKSPEGETDLFYNLAFLAVIINNLLYGAPSWVGRIVYYFDFAFIVFFVRWSLKNRVVTVLTLFYSILFYIHHYIIQHQEGIYPFVMNL